MLSPHHLNLYRAVAEIHTVAMGIAEEGGIVVVVAGRQGLPTGFALWLVRHSTIFGVFGRKEGSSLGEGVVNRAVAGTEENKAMAVGAGSLRCELVHDH